ncbi:MAG TPA: carboxymuconolactone decarboxylase family protein [Xanthobacteraceae bacterium]|nr:carboxymuconolactone decarboxylase family protein [Xanthobacteraceae bacterium]
MARLPYLGPSDLAPENRDLLKRNINLYRIMAYNPDAQRAQSTVGSYIRFKTKLDARLRELAILQVGYVAKSAYEWSHHAKIAQDFGVSKEDIRAVAEETVGRSTHLEPLAKAVLRAAREMAAGDLSDATFATLKASLPNDQLVDLVMSIAFYCGIVRLLAAFRIDVEPEYQAYLEEFPLQKN